MKLNHSSATLGLLVLLGASFTVACNSDNTTGGTNTPPNNGTPIAMSVGAFVIYPMPYAATSAKAGMENPITTSIAGTAKAWDMGGGKMKLVLEVMGAPPSRAFGAHLHKLACDDTKAGGHYENVPWPMSPPDASSANDPMYANPMNEAWLDFTTDLSGKGSATTMVDWVPRPGQAKSIIVHDAATQTGGKAGDKLACLPISF